MSSSYRRESRPRSLPRSRSRSPPRRSPPYPPLSLSPPPILSRLLSRFPRSLSLERSRSLDRSLPFLALLSASSREPPRPRSLFQRNSVKTGISDACIIFYIILAGKSPEIAHRFSRDPERRDFRLESEPSPSTFLLSLPFAESFAPTGPSRAESKYLSASNSSISLLLGFPAPFRPEPKQFPGPQVRLAGIRN